MKKLLALTFLSTSLLFTNASAQVQLPMGTQEFSIAGMIDLDAPAPEDYNFSFDTRYGYFVRDSWQVGGKLTASGTSVNDNVSLGAFTEYNFVNSSNWVPYVGAAFNVVSINSDVIETNSTISGEASAGLKYFINPNLAIRGEVRYEVSKDDVTLDTVTEFDEKRFKDSVTRIFIGTSFYF